MVNALRKSKLVANKLTSLDSETEFWQWYEKEILDSNKMADDLLTFGEAITKVEADFWNRPSRTKRKRDKSNHSDLSSWHRTYGCFYDLLPSEKVVSLTSILEVVKRQEKGSRNYKYVVSAMKKLARIIKRDDLSRSLEEINVVQTETAELQTVTLDDFISLLSF